MIRGSNAANVILWVLFWLNGGIASAWALVYHRVWIIHFCLAVLACAVLWVRTHRRWSAIGAGVVLLVSLLTDVEFLFGINLPIDQLLVAPDNVRFDHWIWPPGRMSVMSALVLPLLSMAVLQWHVRWRWMWWVHFVIATIIMYVVLITHVYQAVGNSVYISYVNMGRSTMLLFIILMAGMVAQRTTRPTCRPANSRWHPSIEALPWWKRWWHKIRYGF